MGNKMATMYLIVKSTSKSTKTYGDSRGVLKHILTKLNEQEDATLDLVMQDPSLTGAEVVNGNRLAFYFNNSRIKSTSHIVLPFSVKNEQLGTYTENTGE